MLKIGDRAPEFELPSEDGEKWSLSRLLAGGPILLYFYPRDFTSVCTRQACMLRDSHTALSASGVRVVGVSSQPPETHARFQERHRLPFSLLCDARKEVAAAYGAVALLGLWVKRVTYLIDEDGIIRDVAAGDFSLEAHRQLLTKALAGRPPQAGGLDRPPA